MNTGYAEVKRNIWSNTISNYVRMLLGMIVGLLTFRMLYQGLNKEQFGFWSLLWSVFGYGILLDFGFGFTAQKRVAELSVKGEWDKLSRVLSTIFYFYLAVAVVVVTLVLVGSRQIVGWFGVSPANHDEFRSVLVVFFLGIGLAFPMGIFPEILRGQQRIRLANNLISAGLVMRLGLIWLALHYQWGFLAIMLIALFFALAPDCLAATFALTKLPAVKVRPRFFSGAMIGETMTFSIFAYINTATNVVLAKTDQIVLGVMLSVTAVAIYQAGAKVADVFNGFTRQMQDTLSPAAAHLHATGDRSGLRDLLINCTRWSLVIATPLFLLCAFYLDEMILLLTGDQSVALPTRIVGHALLLWFYTSILTHSVSKRIFMMCGHERLLMWLGIGEAGANLALSIGLVLYSKSVVGVAIGSLVPALFFGWVYMWPWMARDVQSNGWELFRKTVWPAWLACGPMLLVLIALKFVTLAPGGNVKVAMFVEGALAGAVGAYGLWRGALLPHERTSLLRRLPGRSAA